MAMFSSYFLLLLDAFCFKDKLPSIKAHVRAFPLASRVPAESSSSPFCCCQAGETEGCVDGVGEGEVSRDWFLVLEYTESSV